MASSMRNGAQAATGGQLFKNMIFWVARTKNGGVVTHLENEADLRIADHCKKKKEVIPDSISYEFITDSVKEGVTQLPDRYLIHPPFDQRTQESKKRTRTTFSPDEDAALLIYVESHTKDRTGNQIYKVFAESNPRHTWQSWRNRYMKTLFHYPSYQREKLRSLGTKAPAPAPVVVPADPATTLAACPSPQRKLTMSASAKGNPRRPSASRDSTPAESKEHEAKIEDKENRDQFEFEIRTFVEETRRSVSLYPEVEGHIFHLYELARAVVAQKVANEQVDWRRVAEDLGYDLKHNKGVANRLKKCFEKNLAAFFEASRILQAKLYGRESSPAQSEEDGNESGADDEDQFYQGLEDFQDRSGLPVKRESEVGGKRLKFWHLGQAVLAHRESNGEVDWRGVAGDLEAKYDWRQDQEVVDELKECFKENLTAWFEEVLDDLEKGAAAQEHEEDEFQSNLDPPERQPNSSSPPVGPSGHKRPLDDDDDYDDDPVYLPEKSAKRRRLDRTAEILSTPEEMLGIPSSCTPTGSKFRQQEHDEEEKEGDIEEIYGYAPPVMSSSDLTPPPASDENKASKIKKRSLPSSFYKRPSQDSPAQEAENTSQQPSQPESPDRRASSSELTLLECIGNHEAQGYSRDIVMEALRRTSLRPGRRAEHLMELLSKNEEVPLDIEAVWTDRDDLGLRWADCVRARGSKATEVEKTRAKEELEWLVHKHTEKEIDLRRRYLEIFTWEKA
ncbi:hypothetical protein E4U59_007835 [Claviceps monticola]|nr:hypothetical protein E4U59_007835 [Claviceps monticola]